MIISYAPVEDVNEPLANEEIKRYRKMSRCVWLAETCIGIIVLLFNNPSGGYYCFKSYDFMYYVISRRAKKQKIIHINRYQRRKRTQQNAKSLIVI